MLSGMVRSSRNVRSLTQSSGFVVGKIVGRGVDSITTISCVGWMINVGSMSGAWAVGGRNGVGVGAGEQAERETRNKITMNNLALNEIEECRLGAKRKWIVFIKKGRPTRRGSPQQGIWFILLLRGR